MNLENDWLDASGTIWLTYIKSSDKRNLLPIGHIISASFEKPIGQPNSQGILGIIEVDITPATWGKIVRGKMKIEDDMLIEADDNKRVTMWESFVKEKEEIAKMRKK